MPVNRRASVNWQAVSVRQSMDTCQLTGACHQPLGPRPVESHIQWIRIYHVLATFNSAYLNWNTYLNWHTGISQLRYVTEIGSATCLSTDYRPHTWSRQAICQACMAWSRKFYMHQASNIIDIYTHVEGVPDGLLISINFEYLFVLSPCVKFNATSRRD